MKIKLILLVSLIALGGTFCKKGASNGSSTSAASEGGKDCGDLDAMSARMRCNNNNVEFCSSFSKYKWMETQKCPADKKCFISPDGKSGGCK
ncbi:MAG: hypothetical protein U1F16_08480 [Turneriella sp.]